MDSNISLRDVIYLVFGIVALMGTIWAITSGKTKKVGDERERIVRIDENMKEVKGDVAEIKSDNRQNKKILSDHERRIIRIEEKIS